METAKVDIRRLQLLNDRINQCIDALNQVRLSVHGLSHTTAGLPGIGTSPFGQAPGLGASPFGQVPFGQTPFGQVPFGQVPGIQGIAPGLGHTSLPGATPGMFPGVPGAFPFAGAGAFPFAAGVSPFLGLSHSGAETWADPFLAARIAQTFPYAYQGVPPVVTIY